jgi:hypothetical protein
MIVSRRRVLIGMVLLVALIAIWRAVVFIQGVLDVPRQAYAVWGTADLIIEYMERHEGAWPRSWEDLRPLVEDVPDVKESRERDGSIVVEFRPQGAIEELQRRVEVDWNANPDELLKMPPQERGPPFRVISLRNGKSTHYEGREPNQMIRDYLESRHRRKAN